MGRMKMSSSSWLTSLRENIQRRENDPARKTLFIGVGQDQNGDDAVGLAVIRKIIKRVDEPSNPELMDAGAFPENHTSKIRGIQPDLIVFIDAAQMDLQPGEVKLLGLQEIAGLSASTHSMPFATIGKFLQQEIGCEILILGIQPEQNMPDSPLSKKLEEISDLVSKDLIELVCELNSSSNMNDTLLEDNV
jgi:hydrogenase 3 maturation protease